VVAVLPSPVVLATPGRRAVWAVRVIGTPLRAGVDVESLEFGDADESGG
jgi:hypothetical protein